MNCSIKTKYVLFLFWPYYSISSTKEDIFGAKKLSFKIRPLFLGSQEKNSKDGGRGGAKTNYIGRPMGASAPSCPPLGTPMIPELFDINSW